MILDHVRVKRQVWTEIQDQVNCDYWYNVSFVVANQVSSQVSDRVTSLVVFPITGLLINELYI